MKINEEIIMFTIEDFGENIEIRERGAIGKQFATMAVGEVKYRSFEDGVSKARNFQRDAHVYGHSTGMKFKTKTVTKDGKKYMLVMRIK